MMNNTQPDEAFRKYWAVGAYWQKTKDDKSEEYISSGKWLDGDGGNGDPNDKEALEMVRENDVLVMKSSFTKGSDHKTTCTRVKAIGIVRKINAWYDFSVDWIYDQDKDFDEITYRKTIEALRDDALFNFVKSVVVGNGNLIKSQKQGNENMELNKLELSCFNLLKANRNIILHGAPGTGKTFSAKRIAAKMIFGEKVPDKFEESPEFREQCDFVQFHPSYDYTDFVEGLRPTVKDAESQMGFERCDGIFKDFCKKALKNDLDSKKTKEQLTSELTSEELLDEFINDAIENSTQFKTKNSSSFSIEEQNAKRILISIPNNDKIKSISINREVILTVLNYAGPVTSVKDVTQNILNRKTGYQADSYLYAIRSLLKENAKHDHRLQNLEIASPSIETIKAKNYVFIIDEINRGEASKIFGELFFSIDPGYRGIKGKVKTQYQNLIEDGDPFKNGFYIPENVYIIGTMNDIDRSVESMDFAFRRRFAWYDVKASDTAGMLDHLSNVLKSEGAPVSEIDQDIIATAKAKMEALNGKIAGTQDLGSSYQIGAAYFMKLKEYLGQSTEPNVSQDAFVKLWNYHLEGLITDYLRGTGLSIDEFKKAYDGENDPTKDTKKNSSSSSAVSQSEVTASNSNSKASNSESTTSQSQSQAKPSEGISSLVPDKSHES